MTDTKDYSELDNEELNREIRRLKSIVDMSPVTHKELEERNDVILTFIYENQKRIMQLEEQLERFIARYDKDSMCGSRV